MKEQIKQYFEDLFAAVHDGEQSGLAAFAEISIIQKNLSEIAEKIKPYAMSEASYYDESSFTEGGYKFTKVPPRRMVDYSGVPQWADLKAKQQRIEKLALTAATQFGVQVFDEETGEQIMPASVTFSKPGISVKL